jgi:hypothetical protein
MIDRVKTTVAALMSTGDISVKSWYGRVAEKVIGEARRGRDRREIADRVVVDSW